MIRKTEIFSKLLLSINVVIDDSTVDTNVPENIDIDDTWDIFVDSSSGDNNNNSESPPSPSTSSPDIHSGGDLTNHEDILVDELNLILNSDCMTSVLIIGNLHLA